VLTALLQGHTEVERGEEWRSTLEQLATERVLQEALARAQTALLGRHRSERRGTSSGSRHGYADGTRMPRHVCTPAESQPGIGSMYAPCIAPSGRLRRNAAGPKCSPMCGMKPAW
jgi:hypothetical protein